MRIVKLVEKKLPIIISIIAISISIFTYIQSRKDFHILNRPQLVMKPIKFDNGSYLKCSIDELTYSIKMLIEIKNNGMTTAQDVQYGLKANLHIFGNQTNTIVQDSIYVSIPPGSEVKLEPLVLFKFEDKASLHEFISLLNQTLKEDYLYTSCPIKYGSSYKEDILYRIYIEYKVNNHEVYVLKYIDS